MIGRVLLVGCGGFLGAAARYLAGGLVQRLLGEAFPWGTFVVNASGCLAIGFLAALSDERFVLGTDARLFLLVGVLGGYTTFSSFGLETFNLLRDGGWASAALNAFGQLGIGLAAVWLGTIVARSLA